MSWIKKEIPVLLGNPKAGEMCVLDLNCLKERN